MMIMQNVDNHIETLVGEDYNYDNDYNKDDNDDDHDDAGSGQRHGKASRGGGHGGAQFVLLHPIRSGEECANVGIIIIIIIVIIIVTRPKPAYGLQGLVGTWGQDTDQAGTF